MMQWFCAEVKVPETAVYCLSRQGFGICNPTYVDVLQARRGGTHIRVEKEKSLFPGYLLVQFDKAEDEWERINNTRGVSRLLTGVGSAEPLAVSPILMKDILERAAMGPIKDAEWLKKFRAGQEVLVTEGPLASMVGTVRYSDNDRVWVLLNSMDQRTSGGLFQKPLEFSDSALELVS